MTLIGCHQPMSFKKFRSLREWCDDLDFWMELKPETGAPKAKGFIYPSGLVIHQERHMRWVLYLDEKERRGPLISLERVLYDLAVRAGTLG